jgi:hypothetical protein
VRRVEGIQHLEVSESCRKECVQESSLRLRVVRKLRRDKAFENIEGSIRSLVVAQADKSREESLVSIRRNHQREENPTVRNLWGGLAKSRQPSDLPEKRGGYNCIRSSSSGDCGPSDLT